jgi:chromosome partitioning protein
MGERAIAESIMQTEIEHLSLLPAHRDMVGAEVELVAVIGRQFRLTEALNPVRDQFDFIVIDCPP